jgi:hypothetical protein
MSMGAQEEAIKELWRVALSDYRQEGLRDRLSEARPGDRNVNERIAYDHPPTFQPGYVGPRFFASVKRVVMVGQNPGEGRDPASVEMDRKYRAKLEAFRRGDAGFEELNRLIASHMLSWRVFEGKGIFSESGAGRMSLLDDDVRPSIEDVGYVNYFPFKISADDSPLDSPFQRRVWATYVGRLLELLAPVVIVPMGARAGRVVEAELRGSVGSPKVIRVWHPSAREPREIEASWRSLSTYLRGLA